MKYVIAIMLAALSVGVAPSAAASPTEDQRCSNPAFARGTHVQGGEKILHKKVCEDATMPWDY